MTEGDRLRARVAAVVARVTAAAEAAGRDPADVRILAASKTQKPGTLFAVSEAGISLFGENYVPEVLEKAHVEGIELHFIGNLQRNKARRLLPHITMLQTLHSTRLADALNRHLSEASRQLEVLIQVNIAEEPTKSGVRPDEVAALARHVNCECDSLLLRGFMTLPPRDEPARWHRSTAELRKRLQDDLGIALPELSMGMSGDLEVAIAHGATIVRIGTAIFGPRLSPE